MGKLLDYFGVRLRQFTPRLGSRQRTIEILKTLVIVIPLTLLIWIYSERAQTVRETVDILPKVSVNEPNLVATIDSLQNTPIAVTLDGPHAQIQAVKEEISKRLTNNSLSLALPTALAHVGRQNMDVVSALNAEPLFTNSGVTVAEARPSYVTIAVSELKTITLNVVQTNPTYQLQNVSFDPPRITVSGPAPVIDATFPDIGAGVAVNLADRAADMTTIGSHTLDLPLSLPPLPDSLHVSATQVKMSYDVSSSDREITLPPVLIVVQKYATQEGQQQVILKSQPLLQNVRVRGPANTVSKMEGENASIRPTAVLVVTPDDTGKGEQNKPLVFKDLPPDVKLVNGPFSVDFDVRDVNNKVD